MDEKITFSTFWGNCKLTFWFFLCCCVVAPILFWMHISTKNHIRQYKHDFFLALQDQENKINVFNNAVMSAKRLMKIVEQQPERAEEIVKSFIRLKNIENFGYVSKYLNDLRTVGNGSIEDGIRNMAYLEQFNVDGEPGWDNILTTNNMQEIVKTINGELKVEPVVYQKVFTFWFMILLWLILTIPSFLGYIVTYVLEEDVFWYNFDFGMIDTYLIVFWLPGIVTVALVHIIIHTVHRASHWIGDIEIKKRT